MFGVIKMTEIKGILQISKEAQSLIDSGEARIEKSNVVYNPGSGKSGVYEWGKFRQNKSELTTEELIIAGAVVAVGVGAAVAVSAINKKLKRGYENSLRISNELISQLTFFILELEKGEVLPSTILDLKRSIRLYMEDKNLKKIATDSDLEKNLNIIMENYIDDLQNYPLITDKIIEFKKYLNGSKDCTSKSDIKKVMK